MPQLHRTLPLLVLSCLLLTASAGFAHDISEANRQFVAAIDGPAPFPFFYLGAKHMVTGIDHILFLIGVVFFLHRMRDVVLYVSMFTIGHSLTLMGGVLIGAGLNAYIVDAIIGLSVVYKGLENIGGLKKIGLSIDTRLAVLVFGLFHGLGLATKLMDLTLSQDGLLTNLISFNVGVEVGQVIVLAVVVVLLNLWRKRPSFASGSYFANLALIVAGLLLTAIQLTGYFSS